MSDRYGEGYFEHGHGSNYRAYGDDPGWRPTAEVLRKHVTGDCLYEVGCAKGYFVQAATDAGFDAFGSDVSSYAIAAAPSSVQPRLSVRDATNKNGLDELRYSYDVVVSWEFLEHIAEADIWQVTKNMDDLLVPGGLMVHRIGVYDPERPEEFHSDATHVLAWTRRQWEEWFEGDGYQRVSDIEQALDAQFRNRDWHGRFFAYRKPSE